MVGQGDPCPRRVLDDRNWPGALTRFTRFDFHKADIGFFDLLSAPAGTMRITVI
jgi:hypothetical protein